jgi:hypothetical protein
MWDGTAMKTLTMGANATTIGIGDVTGIVRRTTIDPAVTYTFGSQYMTAYFPNYGTLPTEMSAKIRIGTAPAWRTGAINREIEIIQTGGNGTKAEFSYHYLDSELNGNDEEHLVFWVGLTPTNFEYGRSAYNSVDNWVSLSNVNVAFFSSSWDGTKNITLDEYSSTTTLTWNGSLSDSWTSVENWTPNVGPSSDKNIIIPDASTTLFSPTLPSTTEIKTLTIDASGVLNASPSAQLTINVGSSALINYGGMFNPSTSKVLFTGTDATITGTINFFDVTTTAGKVLWLTNGSTMRIAGTMDNQGTWRTVVGGPTTVEYNGGDQTVVIPNAATNRYYNLTLSGSGIKTMPTGLTIYGVLSMEGTASMSGTAPSFSSGAAIEYSGNSIQTTGIELPSTFNGSGGLTIDNTYGVILGSSTNIAADLTLKSGKLTINPGINLTVGGTTHLSGTQCLVIKSNATSMGSFIDNGFSGSGTAKVERWVSTNSDNRWEYISSPIASASSSIFTTALRGLWYANEPTNAWVSIPNASPQTMVAMKGYARKYLLTEGDGDLAKEFSGSLNTGEQSISLTGTSFSGNFNGWNLVGNPYPSTMDWNATSGWTKTNLDNAIYFRTNGNFGSYIAGVGTNGGTQYIPPMQSFWVRVTAGETSGALSCNNDVRVHNSQNIYKSQQNHTLHLTATNQTNGLTDDTYIRFDADASDGFDSQFDAFKMFAAENTYPQIYTQIAADNISINSFSELTGQRTIPMGFKSSLSGQFTFTADMVSGFIADGFSVYLEDLLSGAFQDLSQNNTYTFASGVTTGVNRFVIHINPILTNTTDNEDSPIQIFAFQNEIHLTAPEILNGQLVVYDMLGQVVVSKAVSGSTSYMLQMGTESGVYLVKYCSKDANMVKKIVLKPN